MAYKDFDPVYVGSYWRACWPQSERLVSKFWSRKSAPSGRDKRAKFTGFYEKHNSDPFPSNSSYSRHHSYSNVAKTERCLTKFYPSFLPVYIGKYRRLCKIRLKNTNVLSFPGINYKNLFIRWLAVRNVRLAYHWPLTIHRLYIYQQRPNSGPTISCWEFSSDMLKIRGISVPTISQPYHSQPRNFPLSGFENITLIKRNFNNYETEILIEGSEACRYTF